MVLSKKRNVISLLLVLALLVCCLPVWPALEAAAETTAQTVENGFAVGEEIFHEDFSGIEDGSLPTGWDKDTSVTAYTSLLWAAANAQTGADNIKVTTMDGVKGLYLETGSNASHIYVMPDLGTEAYVATMKVISHADSGSIAFITNLATDYANAAAITGSIIYMPQSGGTTAARIYQRAGGDKGQVAVTKEELSLTANVEYTITVYYYGGMSYFYLDGTLIGRMADWETSVSTTRAGIYTCAGKFLVTDVQVNAIKAPTDDWYVGESLFAEDFTELEDGAIPATWDATTSTTAYADYYWNVAAALTDTDNIAIKTVDDTKGLYLSPANGNGYADHILVLPDVGSENYVMTVEVTAQTSHGTFGLVTGLPADYASATVSTRGTISTHNDPSVYLKQRIKGSGDDYSVTVSKADWTAQYGAIASGNTYTLQALHVDGVTYFYIDGAFVAQMDDRATSLSLTCVGLYTCGGDWFVSDIQVNAVAGKATTDIKEKVKVVGTLYAADFTAEDPLAGWTTQTPEWSWIWQHKVDGVRKDTGVVELKTDETTGETGLRVQSNNGTRIALLPALGASNYVLSMDVTASKAGFGLLANVSEAGATHAIAYADARDDGIHYNNRVGGSQNDKFNLDLTYIFDDAAIAGEKINMTLYVYEGVAYYFINDKFVHSSAMTAGDITDVAGIYTCSADAFVTNISAKLLVSADGTTDAITMPGASIRYADPDGTDLGKDESGIRFATTLNKQDVLYKLACGDETYAYSADADFKMGTVLLPADMLAEGELLTADTPLAVDVPTEKIYSQDADTLMWMTTLLNIPQAQLGRSYTARSYVDVTVDGETVRLYTEQIIASPAHVANLFYPEATDDVKAKLDAIYEGVDGYMGKEVQKVTFSLFADFHYKENMYMSSIADMQSILDRANTNDADFIIHAGDFCNDYSGSPELMNAYLQNNYNLPAYGIYGNHELETAGNTMSKVTPWLTNQADNVVWGTESGKIEDGSIGYYYYEVNGFRFICLDTNYSKDSDGNWVHNVEGSYGAASTNTEPDHLGDVQKAWLETVLDDAAEKEIPCVVFAHHSFSGVWTSTAEAADVRAIFNAANAKKAGTVMMVLNGHLHTNHSEVIDGILYMDINTVRNGYWQSGAAQHYTDGMTFKQVVYDDDGNATSTYDRNLSELSQASNTYFFTDPLSAMVTIYNTGDVYVEGAESSWIYDVAPSADGVNGTEPRISDIGVSLW